MSLRLASRALCLSLAAAAAAACGDGGAADSPDAAPGAPDAGAGLDAPPAGKPVLARPSRSSTIAITDDDRFVVMVNPDDDSISIFRTEDHALTARVATGDEPASVVLSPDGTTAFVANRAAATVVKVSGIDTATPEVSAPLATGSEPTGLALSPTGATLFVAELAEGSVLVVDTASMTARGAPIEGALRNPRALAVTNDGDGDDADELLLVPEFFGEPNEHANDASTLDRSRSGRVRIYDLAQDPPAPVAPIVFAPRDTGIRPGGAGNTVTASPNQLGSVVVRRDPAAPGDHARAKIYVPSVSVAPQGPPRFDGNVYPIVYVGDLGARAEVTTNGTTNLSEKVLAADGPAPAGSAGQMNGKLFLADIVDLAFLPAGGGEGEVAYVVSRGADAVQRVTFGAQAVSIGSSVRLQIDVASGCKAPTGIVLSRDGARAYLNCWASRTLGVVELGNTQRLTLSKEAVPPSAATAAVDRGRRFFFTGRGRWSGNGLEFVAPTLNDLGWSSCASCHPDGLTDNVTWIFATGPRQTTSMDGSFSHGAGPQEQRVFNWTGIFDEVHDFERNTRGVSGGLGAMTTGTCGTLAGETRTSFEAIPHGVAQPARELQDVTGNCTTDWDDLDAWVRTIRPPRGLARLDAAKVALGAQIFASGTGTGSGACADCHGGAGWTVSRRFFTPSSEKNGALAAAVFSPGAPWSPLWNTQGKHIEPELPGPVVPPRISCGIRKPVTAAAPGSTFGPAALEKKPDGSVAQGQAGYNVPSLYGLALGAPYLHAGQAPTLRALLDDFEGHTKAGNDNFSATAEQKDALVAFLLSIDGSTPEIAPGAGHDKCTE
jgi:DNA-binding beta-propeller fold protein YncE